MTEADYEAQLPEDQQKQIEAWRQYDASRPMVDPNEDAKNYIQGNSGN